MTDLAIMCSHTLQQMDVSDTGLQLAALFLSPFLEMGTTKVVFCWWGILPIFKNVVNMEVRWGAKSSANSFSSFDGILLGPLVCSY